jgi:hypothetical protein
MCNSADSSIENVVTGSLSQRISDEVSVLSQEIDNLGLQARDVLKVSLIGERLKLLAEELARVTGKPSQGRLDRYAELCLAQWREKKLKSICAKLRDGQNVRPPSSTWSYDDTALYDFLYPVD